jgi:hypothetical protein
MTQLKNGELSKTFQDSLKIQLVTLFGDTTMLKILEMPLGNL